MSKPCVQIQKIPVHGDPDRTHAWAPIVDGKVVERRGSPSFSISTAKSVAADHLGVGVGAIAFSIG